MSESSRFPETPIGDRMQDVLTRATQDRVHQEHTQGIALEEIRQRLQKLESELHEVRERSHDDSAALETLSGQLTEMNQQAPPGWAERLTEHLEAVREQVKPLAELKRVAGEVDEALARINTLVEADERNERRFDGLDQRLDQLQARVDSAITSVGKMEGTLTKLGDQAERLERSIQAMGDRTVQGLEALGNRIGETAGRLDGRLDGIQGRLDGVDDRLGGIHDRLENMPATLQTPEMHRRLAELAALAERPLPPDHSAQLGSLDERLREAESHLVATLDGLGQDVRARPEREEVEDTVARRIEPARDQFMQRISALENSVLALAEALFQGGTEPTQASGTAPITQLAPATEAARGAQTTESTQTTKAVQTTESTGTAEDTEPAEDTGTGPNQSDGSDSGSGSGSGSKSRSKTATSSSASKRGS